MGDVIQFTNPRWLRLAPWWPQPHEINTVVVYDFLGWEVPRFATLSVFELRLLDHLAGYRHREVYNLLEADKDRRDRKIAMELYGNMPPYWEAVNDLRGFAASRWPRPMRVTIAGRTYGR